MRKKRGGGGGAREGFRVTEIERKTETGRLNDCHTDRQR